MPKLTRVISHPSRDVTRAAVFLEMLRASPKHIQNWPIKICSLQRKSAASPLASARKAAFIPPRSVAAIARSPASGEAVIIGSGSALTRITIISSCDGFPKPRTHSCPFDVLKPGEPLISNTRLHRLAKHCGAGILWIQLRHSAFGIRHSPFSKHPWPSVQSVVPLVFPVFVFIRG